MAENFKLKIAELKSLLKKYKIDGYFVPMNDEFFCEYVPQHARRLEFLTGFTGSAGSCFIGKNTSIFETDGRYELQAQTEVVKHLDKVLITPQNTIINWLAGNIKQKTKIGFDPKLISKKQLEKFENINNKNIKFVAITNNLVDEIWQTKPSEIVTEIIKPAFALDIKFTGKSHSKKISESCKNIKSSGAEFCLLTLPESVCWLLNIRGYDLPHTPFLLAFALVDVKTEVVTLYTNPNKISASLVKKLGNKIIIKNLTEIEKDFVKLKQKNIQACPNNTSIYFYDLLQKSDAKIINAPDPCILPKACKNEPELEGIRNAHNIDGAAIVKFLYWLEQNKNLKTKNSKNLTEISIAEKLEDIRKEHNSFFGLSFDTIAGFGANGAIIHYRANEKSNKKLIGTNLLLLDSGAQYLSKNTNKNNICGTTDITRTIALGKPTSEQKRNFTLVLKGHIAIASAKFVKGTNGAQLDVLARKFLWAKGKDYAHGTGHGVGHFLNVHEGPQGISKYNQTPLAEGMIISNEPGFYKAGEYGIRIENLVVVTNVADAPAKTNNFLQFETLTKAPIDLNLIDATLLEKNEKLWLNNYHAQVLKDVAPFLNAAEIKWLKSATKKIK